MNHREVRVEHPRRPQHIHVTFRHHRRERLHARVHHQFRHLRHAIVRGKEMDRADRIGVDALAEGQRVHHSQAEHAERVGSGAVGLPDNLQLLTQHGGLKGAEEFLEEAVLSAGQPLHREDEDLGEDGLGHERAQRSLECGGEEMGVGCDGVISYIRTLVRWIHDGSIAKGENLRVIMDELHNQNKRLHFEGFEE